MSWSVLQSASKGDGQVVANPSLAFTSNVSAGSKLIAYFSSTGGASNVSGVQDNNSNAFTDVAGTNPSGTQPFSSVWILDTPSADVGTKPTISGSDGGNYTSIIILEVAGLAAGNTTAVLDGSPGYSSGVSTGTITSPSYSSTASGEFLLTAFNCATNAHTITGVSGSETYTIAQNIDGSSADFSSLALAYANSGNKAETATWALASGSPNWTCILVAFKLASAASAPVPYLSQNSGMF